MGNVDNLTTNLKECNEEVRINVVEGLISSMSEELSALATNSYTVCIYRVSVKYRKSKEEAYTPRVVSVGPLHHGKIHLQAMEAYKLRYLQSFISKLGIGIDKLIKYAAKMEASVRGCYEDTSEFQSKEFLGNTKNEKQTPDCEQSRHLVEFLVFLHRPSSNRQQAPSGNGRCQYTISASQLHAAGVRFDHGMGELFEVSFNDKDGQLKLSQLTVNDETETFFRNLIAYEQCGHYEKHITSYIIFMDSLMKTAEDVDLLVKHGVIDNLLGESKLVATLFNNLCKEVMEEQKDFYFAEICNDLNKYSKTRIHKWNSKWFKWKLILKEKYFSNPWSFVAFLAASAVIVLTVVQTVCSILQTKNS
ncbi:hypothetical protein POM88_018852 [Heracleum sosnowskyi]|uniref:Uncharacterized protein n=1 Tax=Heracleum sosnowskyi TaxID=360622 RepID=A0AAD8IT77_9APIA|nr:hypothetical protein POM88_018852 [Heracleum sosnowskyi]